MQRLVRGSTAVHALAALGREERDDVVAGLEQVTSGPDRLDHARALVAEHRRRVAGGVDARGGVEVGVADAAGDQPDQHLAGLRLGEVDLLDGERLAELLQHRGAHLHRTFTVGDPTRPRAVRRTRSGFWPMPTV